MVCVEINDFAEIDRNNLIRKLKENGIDSRPYFYQMSDMPMYKKVNTPITHKVYIRGINLPSYFEMADSDIEYICKIINQLIK